MTGGGELLPATVILGASRGIGRSIAKIAARDVATVVLVARSEAHLEAVAEEIRSAGGRAVVFPIDLASRDASKQLESFLAEYGLFCDVLVNNAGYGLRGAATLLPIADQLGMIDLNIRTLADFTLRFSPGMARRGRGGVINLGSVASFLAGPNMAVYYASKSFVRSFSAALSQELRATGVTVTCVAPGPTATDFLDSSGAGRATLFKILPKLSADYVAEQAWRGFRSGRRLVVPGVSAKVLIVIATVLPNSLLLPLVSRLQRRKSDLCPCGSGETSAKCKCSSLRS
ncbi:SDR family NAD(P)-dependent oxidoreductase [Rhizobium grahamii]|uniref:SDR family NAD(P)-dependent oxidoreductase n=1 Tax=Rhizobium grahamii TaxID=1120045 RepID=A0A5Q0C385_9HYPH|nr:MULTISPECIES: SDR family oxidoreductase [Rhizobium]QFY59982.1 SDR family NAD(P)-dependent oxidoreductase [Rhizobium grahamii]QRM50898.1 SDR family NAD(P)-dependent oxidoreductase [Rhizobium sp. BG6]